MSILKDIQKALSKLKIPYETGYFNGNADEYIVVIPLSDSFELFADNVPQVDLQEIRLALYSKRNYNIIKKQLINKLIAEDYTITNRQYIGYEKDTGYHHYNIDVEKNYEMEE